MGRRQRVLDYGADGHLVGIDIDNASHTVQLHRLILTGLHGEVEKCEGLTDAWSIARFSFPNGRWTTGDSHDVTLPHRSDRR